MKEEPISGIATPEEVLATFTAMLRGEKPAEQMKAAENLAKHYGMLTPREDRAAVKPEIAEEIEEAMRSLEACDGQDGP